MLEPDRTGATIVLITSHVALAACEFGGCDMPDAKETCMNLPSHRQAADQRHRRRRWQKAATLMMPKGSRRAEQAPRGWQACQQVLQRPEREKSSERRCKRVVSRVTCNDANRTQLPAGSSGTCQRHPTASRARFDAGTCMVHGATQCMLHTSVHVAHDPRIISCPDVDQT